MKEKKYQTKAVSARPLSQNNVQSLTPIRDIALKPQKTKISSASTKSSRSSNSLSNPASTASKNQPSSLESPKKARKIGFLGVKTFVAIFALLLIVGGTAFAFFINREDDGSQVSNSSQLSEKFDAQIIDLEELASSGSLGLVTSQSLSVNGQLRTNNSLVLAPIDRPAEGTTGQLYFDKNQKALAYYNGTQFLQLASTAELNSISSQVQSLRNSIPNVPNIPSDIATLGAANNFNAYNRFTAGVGAANLNVANTASIQGSLNVAGNTTLGPTTISNLLLNSPLGVSSGGTGTTSLTKNGVVIGQGSDPLTTVTAASTGLCLMSTAGAPSFQACPGGSGAGVTSLNGADGDLSIANSTVAGTTITMNNASTATKGIAQFNAANFSVSSGNVNTIQNIGTTAAPTFGGLTINGNISATNVSAANLSGNGSGVTNVNAAQLNGQAASYYLNASNINTGTLADARLSSNVALKGSLANFTAGLQRNGNDVCDSSNNCNYLTGSAASGLYIELQGTTPGTAQTGNLNITGAGIFGGNVSAANLSGNGSGVTNVNAAQLNGQAASYYLNASNINTGTLADARLSTNVTLAGNTFNTADNLVKLNNSGQLPALDGSLLTALNASSVNQGTLADARLSSNVALKGSLANFTAGLQRNGNDVCDSSNNCNYLTGSAASGLYIELQGTTPGTAQTGNLNITGAGIFGGNVSAANLSGNGSGVTNVNAAQLNGQAASYYLNASNINTGTLADARLSSNVALKGSLANFTAGLQRNGNDVCDSSNNCNYLTGSAASGLYIELQGTTPGTAQTGNLNITGAGIFGGNVSAANLSGNGSGVTNVNAAQLNGQAASYYLNASNINTGTLADARLSTNVTLAGNTFNTANNLVKLNASGQLPALDGSLLTNVNAAQLNGQAASYYLNASNINTGTLADARLSSNVALKGSLANFTAGLQSGGSDVCTMAGNCIGPPGGQVGGSGTAGTIAVWDGSGFTLTDSIMSQSGGAVTVSGGLGATSIKQNGNDVCDSSNNCNYLTGSAASGLYIELQGTTPGTAQTGNLNITGAGIFGGNVSAANLSGNGSGVTNVNAAQLNGQAASYYLNASNINTGTLADARLSSNVALKGSLANFTAGLQSGGSDVCTTAGNCVGTGGGGAVGGSGTAGTIAVWDGSGFTLTDSIMSQSGGAVTVSGDISATNVSAANLSGNGSGVTNVNAAQLNGQAASYYLNASNINTGTLADARLSTNVTLAGNTFNTADNLVKLNNSGQLPALDGSLLTALNASSVNQGTLADARLSSNVALKGSLANFTAGLQRNGNDVCDSSNNCNYLTGSAASGLYIELQGTTPGTAQTGNLNITGAGIFGGNVSAANLSGNGSGVTNVNAAQLNGQAASYYLNASNINTGTLADARLSTNVTLAGNTFNTANNLVKLNASGQLPALDGSLLTNVNAALLQGESGSYYLNLGNATGTLNIARIADSSLTNAKLQNSSITVTAGTGLSGGGAISLGGSAGISLGNTTVSSGSYGSGSSVATFTVDAQGRLIAAGSTSIGIDTSQVTSGTLSVARGGTGGNTSQAAINSISQLTTAGDLLYHNGSNSTRLARGTNGQCLTSTGSNIQWGSCGGGGSGWSLTGNAGTSAGTNFIGTTDSQDLVLKTNTGGGTYGQITIAGSNSSGQVTIKGGSGGGEPFVVTNNSNAQLFKVTTGNGIMGAFRGSIGGTQACFGGTPNGSSVIEIGGCSSSKAYKNHVTPLESGQYDRILEKIQGTNIYTYYHNTDAPDYKRTGVISEYMPSELTMTDQNGHPIPDWMSVYGYLWAGTRSLADKTDKIESIIDTKTRSINADNGKFSGLNVSGESKLKKLSVKTATVEGGLTVKGSTTVESITVNGHIITKSGQPTASAQPSAGSDANVKIEGTDTIGTITVTTGSNPSAGSLSKITFSDKYKKAPRVVISPSDVNAAKLRYYKGGTTKNNFKLNSLDSPTANTTYKFDYFIAE